MREISEDEAHALGGDGVPPVLSKTERDDTQSAVCLKRLPDCFLLGVSSETRDYLQLFVFDNEEEARAAFDKHCAQMTDTGYPFFD